MNNNKVFNRIKHNIVFIWNYECQICCIRSVNLHVHHIDKNHSNNDVFNLLPLCPSCHRTVHKLGIKLSVRPSEFQRELLNKIL